MNRREVMAAAAVLAASAVAPMAFAQTRKGHSNRVRDLISQMTLAEKFGQMTQIPGGRQRALNSRLDATMLDRVRKGEMGSFLHVAGAEPLRDLQRIAVTESRLKIPLLFAMDVIHGYRSTLPDRSRWHPLGTCGMRNMPPVLQLKKHGRQGCTGPLPPWWTSRMIRVGAGWSRAQGKTPIWARAWR